MPLLRPAVEPLALLLPGLSPQPRGVPLLRPAVEPLALLLPGLSPQPRGVPLHQPAVELLALLLPGLSPQPHGTFSLQIYAGALRLLVAQIGGILHFLGGTPPLCAAPLHCAALASLGVR